MMACPNILPLSARTADGLRRLAETYVAYFSPGGVGANIPLEATCRTAATRQTHHSFRLCVLGASSAELHEGLKIFLRGEQGPGSFFGRRSSQVPMVGYVFPGQGGQWLGMGRGLYESEATFRNVLDRCDRLTRKCASFSIVEELYAEEVGSRLSEIDVLQPVLVGLNLALSELWWSWGIVPDGIVGTSLGELAASSVSGAIDIDDAIRLACNRSRLLRTVAGQGSMAFVLLSAEAAKAAIVGYEDRLSVAVNNGPEETVLSGEPHALDEVLKKLRLQDVFCRPVRGAVASHSPHMEPLLEPLRKATGFLRPADCSVRMYSAVTTEPIEGRHLGSSYWVRNLRQPVLLFKTVTRMLTDGFGAFLEISPNPTLWGSLRATIDHLGKQAEVMSSLRRDHSERGELLATIGKLYTLGCDPKWDRILPRGDIVRLPAREHESSNAHVADSAQSAHRAIPAVGPQRGRSSRPPALDSQLDAKLRNRSTKERGEILVQTLRQMVADELGEDDLSEKQLSVPFRDLGLPSFSGITIRDSLAAALGRKLPAGLLFSYPTVCSLAEHLADGEQPLTTVPPRGHSGVLWVDYSRAPRNRVARTAFTGALRRNSSSPQLCHAWRAAPGTF